MQRLGAAPLVRQVTASALTLATGYLGVGLLVEGARRLYPSRGVLTLSFALDALPARVLSFFGLLEPLREAYLSGRVSEAGLRVVFGAVALAVIFLLAAGLGLVVALLKAFFRRGSSFPQ
jgi:hypothetical protein